MKEARKYGGGGLESKIREGEKSMTGNCDFGPSPEGTFRSVQFQFQLDFPFKSRK